MPVLLEVLGSVVGKHPSIDVLPVMRFLTTPSSAPPVNFEYAITTCKSKACNKWHARITECGRYRYSSNTNLAYGLMTRQDGWKFGASYFGFEICIQLVGHFPGARLIGRALRFHHSGETQDSEIWLIAKLWLRYRRFKLPMHRTMAVGIVAKQRCCNFGWALAGGWQWPWVKSMARSSWGGITV